MNWFSADVILEILLLLLRQNRMVLTWDLPAAFNMYVIFRFGPLFWKLSNFLVLATRSKMAIDLRRLLLHRDVLQLIVSKIVIGRFWNWSPVWKSWSLHVYILVAKYCIHMDTRPSQASSVSFILEVDSRYASGLVVPACFLICYHLITKFLNKNILN